MILKNLSNRSFGQVKEPSKMRHFFYAPKNICYCKEDLTQVIISYEIF